LIKISKTIYKRSN